MTGWVKHSYSTHEVYSLNAHMTLDTNKCCSFLATVSIWPLHTRIYKHGGKTNTHLLPKAHDVCLCWSNAVSRDGHYAVPCLPLCFWLLPQLFLKGESPCAKKVEARTAGRYSERKEWEKEREEKMESRSSGRHARGCGLKDLGWIRRSCLQEDKKRVWNWRQLHQNSSFYVL